MNDEEVQRRKLLAANTILLEQITETPALPQECSAPGDEPGRQLSGKRERQLVDYFAFLSSLTDDADRITAAAVEEDKDGRGLTITIAANAGDLTQVQSGLQRVGDALSRYSSRREERSVAEDVLFREIIALAHPRILQRLRSRHAPKSHKAKHKPKPTIRLTKAIDTALSALGGLATGQLVQVQTVQRHVEAITASFDALEELRSADSNKGKKLLAKIVRDFSALRVTTKPFEQFWALAIRDLNEQRSLPDKIRKVSRYETIASNLSKIIRRSKYSLFEKVRVVVLNPSASDRSILTNEPLQFYQVFDRDVHSHLLPDRVRSLEVAYTEAANSQPKYKVHAEVKLLFHYQRNRVPLPPRVIGSSKAACFMCHLLFSTYGGCSVIRTHGVVYHKWMLPNDQLPAGHTVLQSAMDTMNQNLGKTILHLLREPKRPGDHPNESFLGSYSSLDSASTVVSLSSESSTSSSSTITPNRSPPIIIATEPESAPPLLDLSPAPVESEAVPEERPSSSASESSTSSTRTTTPNGSPPTILTTKSESGRPPLSISPSPIDAEVPAEDMLDISPPGSSASSSITTTPRSAIPVITVTVPEPDQTHVDPFQNATDLEAEHHPERTRWICQQVTSMSSYSLDINNTTLYLGGCFNSEPSIEICWIGYRRIKKNILPDNHSLLFFTEQPQTWSEGAEIMVHEGAALSQGPLVVDIGDELVVLKYAFGREPPEPLISTSTAM